MDFKVALLHPDGQLLCVTRVARDGEIIGRVERGFHP